MKPIAYYKFETLPEVIRTKNKIRSNTRLDCIKTCGVYSGIEPFVNYKGMFYLNLAETRGIIQANDKRVAEYCLTGNGLNFTSLYHEQANCDNSYYGYPNGKPKLKDGSPNLLLPYRNDLYLILSNKILTEFEVLIFKDAKGYASHYLQRLLDGDFDEVIEEMRYNSHNFYEY